MNAAKNFHHAYGRVRLFWSIPDSYHNISLWNQYTSPLLYVTGLSGSGKTTLCEKLEKQYGCPYISLDALRFYDTASPESKHAVDKFLRIYPHITTAVKTQWPRQGLSLSNEREYAAYMRLFVHFLNNRAIQEQRKYIVEGIQLFVRLPKEMLTGQPKVILGTGGLECFCRATKRTYSQLHLRFFPTLLRRFLRYSIIQLLRLNHYKAYWKKHEPTLTSTRIYNQ